MEESRKCNLCEKGRSQMTLSNGDYESVLNLDVTNGIMGMVLCRLGAGGRIKATQWKIDYCPVCGRKLNMEGAGR